MIADKAADKTGNLTSKVVKAFAEDQKYDLSRISASIPSVVFDGGYLAIVKEAVNDKPLSYVHRFIYLGDAFDVAKISKPFVFVDQGNETCQALTLDESKEKLKMDVVGKDNISYAGFVDSAVVRNMLE